MPGKITAASAHPSPICWCRLIYRAERSAEADMLGVAVPVTEETGYSLICRVAFVRVRTSMPFSCSCAQSYLVFKVRLRVQLCANEKTGNYLGTRLSL